MKPFVISCILFLSFFGILGMAAKRSADEKNVQAKPEQIEGIYIYAYSKPVMETNYLGTVKSGLTMTGSASQCLKKLIKRAKQDHPTAQAIIITDDNFEKADVVTFK